MVAGVRAGDIDTTPLPQGDLALQTIAMPRDTNASGDIFGGWLLSQMDLAGAIEKREGKKQHGQKRTHKLEKKKHASKEKKWKKEEKTKQTKEHPQRSKASRR